MRTVLTALLLGGFVAPGLLAQPKPPPRPAVADTASALAYYRLGLSLIEQDPKTANAALYWALRIEPSWAEALYARRIAMLRADEWDLVKFVQRDRKVRRKLALADTLFFRARLLEPFLYQDLDKNMLMHYYRAAIEQDVRRRNPNVNQGELSYAINNYLRDLLTSDRDPELLGWLAFSERRLDDALRYYAKAIGKKHESPDLHDDRATIFALQQSFDSAVVELEHAIAETKEKNDKSESVIYQPKALLHHRLAIVRLKQDQLDAAHENLTKALEEDLSYYPAHVTLAAIALAKDDTTQAVQEMRLATELKPDEPMPFMRLADLLMVIGQPEEALAPLGTVVEMEPLYAAPHRKLAEATEALARPAEAAAHYRRFLALSPRDHRDAATIRERIVALEAAKP